MGLQKYTDTFLQQEISVDMLPFLNENHLVQLGITTLGARLQFINYVQSLNGGGGSETPPANGHATSPPAVCPPHGGAWASRDTTEAVAHHLAALTNEIASLRTCLHLLTDTVKELTRSQANASVVSIASPSQSSPAPSPS